MKAKFELRGDGKEAYRVRFTKKHWWSKWILEMDGEYVKKYPVNQENCVHHLEFYYRGQTVYGPYVNIYRCTKCGHSQVGKTHLEGYKYDE